MFHNLTLYIKEGGINMEQLDFLSVASITVICYLIGEIAKLIKKLNKKWLPIICGISGAILGAVAFYIQLPDFPGTDIFTSISIGIVSGLSATGAHQIYKQMNANTNDT